MQTMILIQRARMKTVGKVLSKNMGIGPGFDFLRIALATAVVLHHSFLTVLGSYTTPITYKAFHVFDFTLPMFFALSGFLITGSAQRLRLKDFLLNRSIRIVPALAVDIFVSALLLGPLLTTKPLHEYFDGKEFSHYFLNIIGFIHYELPGVFDSNPFPHQVNGSLWTVPYEIGCYAIISGLILFGCVKSSRRIIATFVGFTVLYYGMYYWYSFHPSPLVSDIPVHNYLNNFMSERGNYLYFHFLAGSLVYVLREQIPYSRVLLTVSLGIIMSSTFGAFGVAAPIILSLPIAYVTVFIGLQRIPRVPLYSRGDYSYGVYLYAYPLQQMLIERLPSLPIAQHFVLSMVLVTLLASRWSRGIALRSRFLESERSSALLQGRAIS